MIIISPPDSVKTLPDPVRTEFLKKVSDWAKDAFSSKAHFIQIPDYSDGSKYVKPIANVGM